MRKCLAGLAFAVSLTAQSQPGQNQPGQNQQPGGFKQREEAPKSAGTFSVPPGTHILLSMINSVSSKQTQVGDRIYLETAFPVLSGNKIVIPQGSWVTGTVTEVKRAERMRRRGELQVRFDSLTLPNGVSRNFNSDLGSVDARDPLKHEHDKVTSSQGNGAAAETVAITTASGAGLGAAIGSGAGHVVQGTVIGAGAGAAAGMIGVLMMHGPEASLSKGATVEMVLDRSLTFEAADLDFSSAPPRSGMSDGGSHPAQQQQQRGRWPGIPW